MNERKFGHAFHLHVLAANTSVIISFSFRLGLWSFLCLTLFTISARAQEETAPDTLAETGFESAPLLSFSPQYPLWSDGAKKRRWISLPPGAIINTSDMSQWVFPIGTQVWKEFSFRVPRGNRFVRVETRYMKKVAPQIWIFATYAWDREERQATKAPDIGIKDRFPIAYGISHDLPRIAQCISCHGNGSKREPIIGFQALHLSPLRDHRAIHAEPFTAEMVTLRELVDRRLVTHRPPLWDLIPRSIINPLQSRVIGYMQGNCAYCHNPNGFAAFTGLFLNHEFGNRVPKDENLWRTAINSPTTGFEIPGLPEGLTYRIRAGDARSSAIVYRMKTQGHRMPPFGTKLIDTRGIRLVEAYVRRLQPE